MKRGGEGIHEGSTEPGFAAGDATEPGLESEIIARRARAKLFGRPYEPVRLGRYAVLEKIGAGAMGVVFAAYDGSLDRKVAIKLISAEIGEAATSVARERFVREAKAMARVSHANVVQVYEAGEADDHVFIAMEFVQGSTLRAWLGEPASRGWREIVRMFVAIADGLAAAHDAGVIHRDFKPDNVLVTAEGVPKIADFGLAGVEHVPVDAMLADLSDPSRALTRTGAFMGTPLYMSPEQYAGRRVDARSDQFSFCVALHAALYGQHPFGGETQVELATNVVEGNLREPPERAVPARVRRALARGLASKPEERWPSMRALRDAIDDRRARRPWGLAAAVACTGVAAALALRPAAPGPCEDIEAGLSGVWDESVAARIDARVLDGLADGPAGRAWTELRPRLEAHARAWLDASAEGCRAHAAGELSSDLYDRRQACLDASLRRLQAVGVSLATVDGSLVERVGELAPDPDELQRCTDPVRLTAGAAPPAAGPERDRFRHVRDVLARAEAELALGRAESARAALEGVHPELAGDDDALATARLLEGRLAQASGDFVRAADELAAAIAAADRARNDDTRARALVELVWVLGVDLYLPAEAERVGALARGTLQRAGDHPALRAELESGLGMTALYAGRFDESAARLEQAIELAGDDPLMRLQQARLHGNLASAELRRGRVAVAISHLRRASDLLAQSLGTDHPESLRLLNNLGVALAQAGEHADALEIHRRSLEAREQLYGADHIETANALNGIGLALVELGRSEEAVAPLERSLAVREVSGGREEDLAEARFGLARALERRDLPRARTLATAAQATYTAPHLAEANAREATAVAQWLQTHPREDEAGGRP